MKNYLKLLLLTLILAVLPLQESSADVSDSPLLNFPDSVAFPVSIYGLNPQSDSAAVAIMKKKMAQIRKTRPTVALVLCGGGAKGAAHVGVYKYLREKGIPVDMVLGTSMGGLVGGMIGLGYSPDQIDSAFTRMDWTSALSDRIPREYWTYSQAKYKKRYLLSFPFYYRKSDYIAQKEDEIQYTPENDKYDKLHLGAAPGQDPTTLVKDNLLGSLPSGFVYGQNVTNIISALSVGYQDSMSFLDLPIPFTCIATEMVSGKAKIWHDGKLRVALRSTMSIPGMFSPVRTGGMVLVDGGMRDNYPADLARQYGADIIIGVDLSSAYRTYDKINNLGDIIGQGIDMLGRAAYEYNQSIPDVVIKPALDDYNMLSFSHESIDTIINRGYEASILVSSKLDSVKRLVGSPNLIPKAKPAVDLDLSSIWISDVSIKGIKDKDKEFVLDKVGIEPGSRVMKTDIDAAVGKVYGTGAFDYVTYELLGTKNPYKLVFDTKRGPVNQFGLGFRFDTDEIVAVLVNVGFNVHRLRGSALDFEGKVGSNPHAVLHYSYDVPNFPTLNAMAMLHWTEGDKFGIGNNHFDISFWNVRQEYYLSNMKWSLFDLRAGIKNDYYKLNSLMTDLSSGADYDADNYKNSYLSLFFDGKAETLDDVYFPNRGYSIAGDYRWCFAGLKHGVNPFHVAKFDAKVVIPASRVLAIIPQVQFRFLFGNDIPIMFSNVMGGSMAGRYMDQQFPFIGVSDAFVMQSNLMIGRVDFRFRLFKNNYITGIFNMSDDFDNVKAGSENNFHYGGGVTYSYNSIIGPIKANLHWSSLTHKVGGYVSIGFDF